ncbi:tyrosine-protein phosphatase [Rhodococcus sp. BE178]|uniref:tyrosine-protein phosphatase n=1 Tax=Rhodococcus sp. BE178 TaxID=2817737 RepID=UPI003D25BCB6
MKEEGWTLIPIDAPGTYNVRDAACGPVGSGRLFRSAALDRLEPAGVDALLSTGIRTVVDLRDESEKNPSSTARSWNVVGIPLYDPAFGAPSHGDIDSVYRGLLHDRGHRIVDALRAIAQSPGPVLVHCTAGKDRTGLVVAVALTAVGSPEADVLADYALSGNQVRPHREKAARQLLAQRELDEHERQQSLELHLESPAPALERALAELRDVYGSVDDYLRAHGFTDTDLAALRDRLCGGQRLTVLHVSDVHATASGALYRRVDGTDRLRQVTDTVLGSALRPDAVVITGDLCQSGEFDAYPRLAEAVEDMRARLGCPVLPVPGNHDHPDLFAATFGADRVVEARGYRIVGLDTSTGSLPDSEIDWLVATLAEPTAAGTVLAMHHPPIRAAAAALVGRELAAPERLACALRGTDVRVILAGHFHHPMSGALGDIPVWVGGSLAYLQDTGASAGTVVGLDSPSFSVLRLDDQGSSCVPIPLTDPDVLFRAAPGTTVVPERRRRPVPAALPYDPPFQKQPIRSSK